jgi:predicted patatin/cPLA2 family phospholipase
MSLSPTAATSYAVGDLDVMSVMLERRRAGTKPGRHDDGHQVTLVIEGGGMRGVYVGGMARALGQLQLCDSLDEILAVSAGAFTGTGIVAGHTDHLARVYYNDLAAGAFVDFRRMLARRGPLVSLDFLLDTVMIGRHGFEWDGLVEAQLPLLPVATALDDLQAVALTDLRTADDWRAALLASARIPLWAGPPIELQGRRWVDGFVADPLPIARAVSRGATHVLAMLARAPEEPPSPTSEVSRTARVRLDRLAPGLATKMTHRARNHQASMALITDSRTEGDPRILGLRPTHGSRISSLTSDVTRLRRGGQAGESAVQKLVASLDR